ncbi:MAG: exodeoxyribonuclease VII large subunit [Coriobacteriia bacterium]|nr:exodeoxyribonuclease VII large subunit [Coriobacteriia bacterium]MCL2750094.1 exodeoxyribonuclease VII large subunit [Coriobacteriia bacterium]
MNQEYSLFDTPVASTEPLSVSDALALAKQTLEQITLSIVGEISDLSDNPRYKAVYFTLADQGSALPCLMWRSAFDRLGVQLKSGMQVEVQGRFSLYSAKGRMQFDVRELTLAGEGRLRAQVAQLAAKLKAQGLMDEARKLAIPAIPENIALVTSPRGKAVHDVLRTLHRRFPLAKVLLFGVGVEGKGAAEGLSTALRAADSSEAEVILLVRGGGSYEDLMPFNDEQLALTIALLRKPVITGIGHEPDTSIADMVASLRASTPTAAAEAAAPDQQELQSKLTARESSLKALQIRYVERCRHDVFALQRTAPFSQEGFLIGQSALGLEQTALRLDNAIPTGLATAQAAIKEATQRLRAAKTSLLTERKNSNKHLQHSLMQRGSSFTTIYERILATAAASMESLSPLAVLKRGYALSYDEQNRLLRSVDEITPGKHIRVRLADGSIHAQVTAQEKEGQA